MATKASGRESQESDKKHVLLDIIGVPDVQSSSIANSLSILFSEGHTNDIVNDPLKFILKSSHLESKE
jgi:hypothetical protein